MGTRGIMGVRVDGKDKLTYNHSDSYPECLGVEIKNTVAAMIKEKGVKILDLARNLKLVSEDEKPTDAEIALLSPFADTGVSTGDKEEWYVLLRGLQGDFRATLETGFMIDGAGFVNDSLFCEWGYIVNFDDGVLEAYRGFQEEPHSAGRFALAEGTTVEPAYEGGNTYHPIALIATIPLDELATTSDTDFVMGLMKLAYPDDPDMWGEEEED